MRTGNGLEVQKAAIKRWAAYQGLPDPEMFADEGISGATTDNRPAFKEAVGRGLRCGTESVLVVYKLDRLGRSALDVQETLAVLLDAGVRVVCIADGVDSGNGMGATILRLLTSILSAFAELEKESIRTRLLDGKVRAKAEDRACGPCPPYGWKRPDPKSKQLVPDELEQEAVATIQHLHAQGFTYRKVAKLMNGTCLKPRSRGEWTSRTVYRVLHKDRPGRRSRTQRIERARAEFLAREVA